MKLDYHIKSKIFENYNSFKTLLKKWKEDNETIVFTNGCFDLIHPGHVDSLLKASELGTKLIVGLNSDESVRAIKGEKRPVYNLEARSLIIAAFACVDAVIVFNEKTPEQLISKIIPDILVKGNEYAVHEVVGHQIVLAHGGQVKTLDLLPGFSTTQLINKIKNLD